MKLDAHIPSGPLTQKWDKHRFEMKLISPANKRKFDVIVVGSGLAGASAAATLAELGYNVKCFCFQDSPRRAHSIAAQGGINAAKNYKNDGDSIYRLFYDTIKGGDFRAREANVYRLAQVSVNIIDQCLAQGVPFAREYGGLLANSSFGGAQVSRTFYARGQTGQQLLLGAYQAMERQIGAGKIAMFPRTEMLDLIVIDGKARGIVTRNLISGKIESHIADAVVLGRGGGEAGLGVYLDFSDAFKRLGRSAIEERYGNLFEMYERITGEDPYKIPMRIYPAIHYTMGGLWVDYQLMSTIPGLFVIGEANFSDHGANRLGASALMQGLADGYFILPYTVGDYLATTKLAKVASDSPESRQAVNCAVEMTNALLSVQGTRS